MKHKLAVLVVSIMLLLSATAVNSCDGGTTSPGIGDVQTLVDQQILKGDE